MLTFLNASFDIDMVDMACVGEWSSAICWLIAVDFQGVEGRAPPITTPLCE
jgi:hypothetical protein